MSSIRQKIKKAIFLTQSLKVWLIAFVVGAIIIFSGLVIGFAPYITRVLNFLSTKAKHLFSFESSVRSVIASLIFLIGVLICLFVIYKIYKFFAKHNDFMYEKIYDDLKLAKGPKIVTIGGGTGQYTLLTGLKEHTSNISAIVTTMDSGGSSQLLKTEFGVLPIGDIRNCIVALSPMSEKVKNMFVKRFDKKSSLQGHPVGNLVLTKLIQDLGAKEGIKQFSELLHTRGKVLPVTYESTELVAKTKEGKTIIGESNIGQYAMNIADIGLSSEVEANPEVLEAIKDADAIVIGPGDLFTSIIPNLLVQKVKEAINKSRATKIYVCNVMTKYPDTHCFKVENFAEWIERFVNVDYILINSNKPPQSALDSYLKEKKMFVEPVSYESKKFIKKEVISEKNFTRHDSKKLAEAVLEIYENN